MHHNTSDCQLPNADREYFLIAEHRTHAAAGPAARKTAGPSRDT